MKTDCEKLREMIPAFLDGELSDKEKAKYQEDIKECPDVAEELASLLQVESEMSGLPEKDVPFSVDAKFFKMLEEEKSKVKEKGNQSYIRPWQIAAAITLLIVGFLGGRVSNQGGGDEDKAISDLQSDVKEMKELVMLSMIENQSASERIRAVGYVEEMGTPNNEVINSLIRTLNADENPNVRLAAAQALARFPDNPTVRAELVKSMENQDDPILQIALISILVEIEEKSAIKQLKEWTESEEISDIVKKQAQIGIDVLI